MSEKNAWKRKMALTGGLCGAAYLTANNLLPDLPDFLLGLILGLGLVFLLLGLLPERTLAKLRRWKRRG